MRKPTILIARQGYSGADPTNYEPVGATDAATAAGYCGPKFGVSSPNFQPCVDWYVQGKPGDYVAPTNPSDSASGGSGVLASIGSFFGGLFKGAATSSTPPVTYPAGYVAPSQTPTWLMPVAIGGIGLVAILMLTKKPRQNPARGHRRRRHRRNRR